MKIIRDTPPNDVIFLNLETEGLELTESRGESWLCKMGKAGEVEGFDLEKSFIEKSSVYPEFGRVVVATTGVIDGCCLKLKHYSDSDESLLLKKLNRDLDKAKRLNPKTMILGFATKGFSIPFLFKRSLINGVIPSILLDNSNLKPWEVDILDLKELWEATGFSRVRLNNILECMGLDMYNKNDSVNILKYSKIKGIADLYMKLSHKASVCDVFDLNIDAFEEMPLIERIAEEGYISDEDKNKIIDLSCKMNIEEKEMFITILKASLAKTEAVLNIEFENKILAS